MQDHLALRNEGGEPLRFELALDVGTDFADIISVKEHDFALGNPLHARPLPAAGRRPYDDGANQLVLEEPAGSAKTQVLLSRTGQIDGSRIRFELELAPRRTVGPPDRRRPLAQRRRVAAARDRAAFRRRACPRPGLARRVAPAGAALADVARRAGALVLAVGRGPRSAADADGRRDRDAAGRRDAVVHDGLRARHADHEPADDAARPRARDGLARRPRGLAGHRGRPDDRRRAGQDPARAAPGPGRRDLVRDVLRHRRRHAALSGPAFGGVALDRRRRPCRAPARARPRCAPLDRRVRRSRRRRLRRVRAPHPAWAREPVLEGLRRLPALPRRQVRADADRSGRGAGLRLRRETTDRRARARGLAGRGAARRGSRPRRRSCNAASTSVSGSRREASTRSRSTPTNSRSIRSARTSGTSSGAGSCRRAGARPSQTVC